MKYCTTSRTCILKIHRKYINLSSLLQVGHADPPVSARQSASVPVLLLYRSHPSCYTLAPILHCMSSADHSSASQHLRSLGIRCHWSDDIQCLPNDLQDPSVIAATFGQSLKTTCCLPISTFSTLGVSHVMRYIHRVSEKRSIFGFVITFSNFHQF